MAGCRDTPYTRVSAASSAPAPALQVAPSPQLAEQGVPSLILEERDVSGGLFRREQMRGVLHEPHGTHISHTDDAEVWPLANRMTPFHAYRHRVGSGCSGCREPSRSVPRLRIRPRDAEASVQQRLER